WACGVVFYGTTSAHAFVQRQRTRSVDALPRDGGYADSGWDRGVGAVAALCADRSHHRAEAGVTAAGLRLLHDAVFLAAEGLDWVPGRRFAGRHITRGHCGYSDEHTRCNVRERIKRRDAKKLRRNPP